MKLKLQKSQYRQQGWLFIIFFFAHILAAFSKNEAVVYIVWKNLILKQLSSIQAKCTKKIRSLKNYCNWTPQSLHKTKGYLAFHRLQLNFYPINRIPKVPIETNNTLFLQGSEILKSENSCKKRMLFVSIGTLRIPINIRGINNNFFGTW